MTLHHKPYKVIHNITKLISFPTQVKVISVYNLQKITIQVTEPRGYWRFDLNALLTLNMHTVSKTGVQGYQDRKDITTVHFGWIEKKDYLQS